MTLEVVVIAAIRILGSLPVLRWAFAGALIAIGVDLGDLFLREWLDLGGIPDYQRFDKYADIAYMLTFLAVALRWPAQPRRIAVGLFGMRTIGFVAFEATGQREILLVFPNVFEFWFVFVAGQRHWLPRFEFTAARVSAVLAGLTALKLFQEYALHWGKWLDGFTAFEAVDAVRDWVVSFAP
ncbi:MAG TPA: hypothetical protein VNL92_02080 [Dehalococcoidia bacterium]|nr:hypothetical protein [Dehalococcoidia bacterium]